MRLVTALIAALLAAAPFALAAAPSAPAEGGPDIQWKAPTRCLNGGIFLVHMELTAPAGGTSVAGWLLTPAAFTIDGKPLAERAEKGTMTLPEGAKIVLDIDLGPYLKTETDFELGFAKGMTDDRPVKVALLTAATPGLNFMDEKSVPLEDLKKYNVLLQTNRGDMVLELWPDVAPNHVRNFLDLSYTGFYAGTIFHRVSPDFMIQGGDPQGAGTGNGPRMLKAEFSARKHERGVLSMARGPDLNSASCQFFIMHGPTPGLDGQYSAFGKLIAGYETLDQIAIAPGTKLPSPAFGIRPTVPQKIVKATVVLAAASK